MCGIAGILLKRGADEALVRRTAEALQASIVHRGPDDYGVHVRPDRAFLNRRLAIVDRAGGHQPVYAGQQQRQGIVYNGEVYNYRTLRAPLEAAGIPFHTDSDTEVVLNVLATRGVAGLADLEGMFGLCYWDDDANGGEGEVILARDAFGMKPLYVYEDAQRIIFSSELSAIRALPDVRLTLSPDGVREYLTLRYVSAPHTVYREIRRVAPGHYMRLTRDGVQEYPYEDLTDYQAMPDLFSFEEAKEELHRLLSESVQAHLIGEVPIALLLSGGIDSSVLGSLLWQMGARMECFNIGFPEVNEFAYSQAIADQTGFTLHNISVTVEEMAAAVPRILAAHDEPIADPACFPLSLLCDHVKRHATVVLSGEGADELFAGYPQYGSFRQPLRFRDRYQRFMRDSVYFLDTADIAPGVSDGAAWERFQKYFVGNNTLAQMSTFDMKTWVPDNLMMKADKILMRHSLEGRFPFLYKPLLRFARRLPESFLVAPDGKGKSVLREAFAAALPESILTRPKMGFSVPVPEIMVMLREQVGDLFAASRTSDLAGILDFDRIAGKWDAFFAGDRSEAWRLWSLFVMVAWLEKDRAAVLESAA